MSYAFVIEKSENNYGAWVPDLPDLPGCVATGKSAGIVQKRIREAIELHLAGMREDGDPIPPPVALVNCIDVAA